MSLPDLPLRMSALALPLSVMAGAVATVSLKVSVTLRPPSSVQVTFTAYWPTSP
ncbi:hypothetical protein LP420_12025 [Massilia sp. B-10]|nr:hypothetical protein LP420_12025 [Massilia sp. B-10]